MKVIDNVLGGITFLSKVGSHQTDAVSQLVARYTQLKRKVRLAYCSRRVVQRKSTMIWFESITQQLAKLFGAVFLRLMAQLFAPRNDVCDGAMRKAKPGATRRRGKVEIQLGEYLQSCVAEALCCTAERHSRRQQAARRKARARRSERKEQQDDEAQRSTASACALVVVVPPPPLVRLPGAVVGDGSPVRNIGGTSLFGIQVCLQVQSIG